MRAELVESKSKREILEQELHNLLLQLHTAQLSQLPTLNGNFKQDAGFKPDVNTIKKKLEDELKRSPSHSVKNEELKFSPTLLEVTQLKNEKTQLQIENAALRNSILALNSEVYGAKLAAKYLDKELAGRIQQLQLLGREMRGDRHKTVVRECRRNSVMNSHSDKTPVAKPDGPGLNENGENFGDIRTVVVKRKSGQGLGISITGGREHGVPILISELEPNGPAAVSGQLYIGDAILSVNDRDLRQACHREAVDILKQPSEECRLQVHEECRLQVQYIAADDSDNSLEEDGYNFRFFDTEVCNPNDTIMLHSLTNPVAVVKTPTAPRTPDSTSQSGTTSRPMLGYDTPPNSTELYNESFIIPSLSIKSSKRYKRPIYPTRTSCQQRKPPPI
ncbi:PDZ domain [Popillia japonica]|uniref:PDZ domain n=1 Tax=Popillia japonica TaxID=7064 RepID=A0AAW1K440_POPJA